MAAKYEIKKVTFKVDNVDVVGNLHVPTEGQGPFPAIICAGSLTSVKEIVAGEYARRLAGQGFVTLAIDHRHFGESGGEPRQYEHKERKIADLRAAVDFLISREEVDAARLGAVGICGGAVYTSGAFGGDERIRAIGLVAGAYIWGPKFKAMLGDKYDAQIKEGREAREKFEKTGESEIIFAWGAPESKERAYNKMKPMYDYYTDPNRGAVANFTNGFNILSYEIHTTLDASLYTEGFTRPLALIHCENAMIPPFAKLFFEGVKSEKKAIHWLEGPDQMSFYDQDAQVNPAIEIILKHFADNGVSK